MILKTPCFLSDIKSAGIHTDVKQQVIYRCYVIGNLFENKILLMFIETHKGQSERGVVHERRPQSERRVVQNADIFRKRESFSDADLQIHFLVQKRKIFRTL